jgi:diguanylate cyclase (GGDEF)-like protein
MALAPLHSAKSRQNRGAFMSVQSVLTPSDRTEARARRGAQQGPIRKTVPFSGRKHPASRDLEGVLTSGLLAADKELGHVLREVDEISRALKENQPDAHNLRVAVHPAVWCAVRHALLERELRHLALTDDLTCLYNRRGFFAAATQQLKMARRNQEATLLLCCDVDSLKAINDRFGHREGDLALVRAADALEEVFRDSDVLARIGGDEFAVVAVGASPQDQRALLFRLEESFRKASKDDPRYELSLSVGAAWFEPRRPKSLGELLEQADLAMYEHKRSKQPLRAENS